MPSFPAQNELAGFNTLLDWVRFAASQMEKHECFYGHGFETAWMEASFLVLRSLSVEWDVPESCYLAKITESERTHLYRQIEQRCVDKIPTTYLIGEAWFCHEAFWVTPDVLIPRSPIAELIGQGFEPWLTFSPERVLDLCCGSGCIGIAMARLFPDAHVDLSELSEAAAAVAVENVSRKDLGYQVDIYIGDLFASLVGNRYDLIVSNPPYVDVDDIDSMPAEFRHEPMLGLAAGEDGLEIVHRILAEASNYLTDDGWLICEVGNSAGALIEAYPEMNFDWPEFSQGGHGVFVVSAKELVKQQLRAAE